MKILSEKNVKNGEIILKEELKKLLEEDNAKIYEVIRIIERSPVFLKEHFNRLMNSINLSGIRGNINYEDFKKSIELLIDENKFDNCNVRVSYYYKECEILLFYFIDSHYPTKEQFCTGVHTVTAKVHRNNPNAKVFHAEYKEKIQKIIDETHAFEVILINEDDSVSEGSKSNIFFVKENKLVTSPDENVLLGVTRSKVIEVCENNGIQVERRIIKYEELENFDGAFITGTSNDVLPICSINEKEYGSAGNEVVKMVYELYRDEVMREIK